jgi:hypothetical protein
MKTRPGGCCQYEMKKLKMKKYGENRKVISDIVWRLPSICDINKPEETGNIRLSVKKK